jgi:hypothetical protein
MPLAGRLRKPLLNRPPLIASKNSATLLAELL